MTIEEQDIHFQNFKEIIMEQNGYSEEDMDFDDIEDEVCNLARDCFYEEFGEEYMGDFDDDPFTHPDLDNEDIEC